MEKEIIKAKQKEVDELKEKAKKAKSIVIIDYKGLTVLQDTEMRKELRAAKIEYKVIKNSLILRALESLGYKGLEKALKGPTAVAFGYEDEIAPAKILSDCVAKFKKMELKGGVIDKKVASAKEVEAFAKIPSKPVLVAQLLCMLTSPMRSLAVAVSEIAKKAAN